VKIGEELFHHSSHNSLKSSIVSIKSAKKEKEGPAKFQSGVNLNKDLESLHNQIHHIPNKIKSNNAILFPFGPKKN
jgi:peptidoglycan hydrolase CwlO-like protein